MHRYRWFAAFKSVVIEKVIGGIHEAGQEFPPGAQDPMTFLPNGNNFRTEDIRGDMHDEIERLVGKRREIPHVALHGANRESFALRNHPIEGELLLGKIEAAHRGPGGGQERSLLPAGRGQAEEVATRKFPEPIVRNRGLGSQDDPRSPGPGLGDFLRRHRDRPAASLPGLTISGLAIVLCDGVHWFHCLHAERPQGKPKRGETCGQHESIGCRAKRNCRRFLTTSGRPQYKQFMKTAQAAIANLDKEGVKHEIAGMLWMQGESDAHENQAETYDKNMRNFIAHMREQFKTPEMRFVIARVKDFYGGKTGQAKIVRDAQVDIAKSTEGVEWFDTDDYPMANSGHYNGEGLIMMGKDFAKALPLKESPSSSPPEKHTFHSADGKKTFVAVFTGYDPETGLVSVTKSDRRTTKFKIEMLSEEDQPAKSGQMWIPNSKACSRSAPGL